MYWAGASPSCSCYIPRGGRHSPTRSRPNFPLKTFPKIIQIFQPLNLGAAPAGIKISASALPTKAKKCCKTNSQGSGSVATAVPRNCKRWNCKQWTCLCCTLKLDAQRHVGKGDKIPFHDGNIFPWGQEGVPLVDWTIGHHPQGVREWATSPSGPRDVGTRRPTAERWISGDVRWQQIEARDTGSSLSSSIMPCFKSSSIIEYLVIIVIINHLKNTTQQEHLHVQYVGGQMLWSQYILQLILCTGPLSDIVDKSHLLIDKKNSKWTWFKNYSQFHLLNWKGCSSPPISQHLLSHTWSRVKDLFLGTFLLLWLWCPLFPSESLGLAPFLLSSHSSCDPRLGKLCRQFTCMGANRTCVILRHSSGSLILV